MNKSKPIVARSARELASALNLSVGDAVDLEIRRRLNEKIISAVKQLGWSHAQAARAAGTSRSRLTAILNRNTAHVSTDLMLRVLAALGYRVKVTFSRKDAA